MSHNQPLSPRERYLMKRRQRETVVFTWVGGVLAVLAVIGVLIGFNIVPFPFFTEFAAADKVAQAGDVPCPTGEAQPLPPEKVTVNVENGTNRSGLAGDIAQGLSDLGFHVDSVGNAANGGVEGAITITSGPVGVNSAYTVALAFPDATIVLDSRLEPTVTVTLGADYDRMVDADTFHQSLDMGLAPRPSCLTVSLY